MLKWVEVDLKRIRENVDEIKKMLQPEVGLLAIVKSNAYGHGSRKVSQAIESQSSFFGVDNINEAQRLSEQVAKPILVLGGWEKKDLENDLKQIRLPIYSQNSLSSALDSKNKLKVHLKVDTGMHRLGFRPGQAIKAAKKVSKASHLNLEGVWSHFAQSGSKSGKEYSENQLNNFNRVKEKLEKINIKPKYFHIANSSGILNYSKSHFNLVRTGMMLYGYWPSEETKQRFNSDYTLKPALTFKAKIVQLRKMKKGERIGYGLTYQMKKDGLVAVLPVGYKDGYARHLSNKGEVLVKGRKCSIVGRICMRMTMVDVSKVPNLLSEDEAILIGGEKTDKIRVNELADQIRTIPYEILSRLDEDIERIYFNE